MSVSLNKGKTGWRDARVYILVCFPRGTLLQCMMSTHITHCGSNAHFVWYHWRKRCVLLQCVFLWLCVDAIRLFADSGWIPACGMFGVVWVGGEC